jgi:hypothetical protein
MEEYQKNEKTETIKGEPFNVTITEESQLSVLCTNESKKQIVLKKINFFKLFIFLKDDINTNSNNVGFQSVPVNISMTLSIFGLVFCNLCNAIICCLPFGISSIIFSCISRSNLLDGNIERARYNAKVSFILALVNIIGSGLIVLFFFIIFLMLLLGSGYLVLKLFQISDDEIKKAENLHAFELLFSKLIELF